MKASVSYQELQKLVTEQTQQPLSFEFVDQKTIKVLYEINLGIMKKKVGVDLRVLEVIGTDLRVRYSGGFGMEGLVRMALNLVKDKFPTGFMEEPSQNELLFHLDKIEKLQPVFERIDVKDVNMLTEALEVVGDFK